MECIRIVGGHRLWSPVRRSSPRNTSAGTDRERNLYRVEARLHALCIDDDADIPVRLAAILAIDGRAVWPVSKSTLQEKLPVAVSAKISLIDETFTSIPFDVVLLHGSIDELARMQQRMAKRDGAIIPLVRMKPGEAEVALEKLVAERATSINTAAAGSNASLLAIE